MRQRNLFLSLSLVLAAACSAELKKLDGDTDSKNANNYPTPPYPSSQSSATNTSTGLKVQTGMGCQDSECRDVKVFVHYALVKDLGSSTTVQVEAFDNKYFQGSPKASGEISDFHAQTGEWRDTTLSLQPGEYYLRAYLSNRPDPRTPNDLEDMQPTEGSPLGIYGALSAPQSLRVQTEAQAEHTDPVDITLDKLFEKPGSEPDTKAHLRLLLSLGDGATVPDNTPVRVRLYTTTDLAHDPAYDFNLPSSQFLVTGHVGTTEFVTPSLLEGEYIVFVFVDTNTNGFFDAGELGQLFSNAGQPQKVHIALERTETIDMQLVAKPTLPK